MRFARWVFWVAGGIGVFMIAPMYFREAATNEMFPPDLNHPEYYYGFAGLCLAWQLMFLVIGIDPVRYRLAMIPAMLEKLGFVAAVPVLVAQQRLSATWLALAAPDALWLVLFAVAFWRTPRHYGK